MPEALNPNQPQPVDPTPFVVDAFSFSASQDFPIEFELSGKSKHLDFSDGRDIFLSPGQEVTLTNVDDPSHSVTLNITGSFHQTTLENGSVLTEYDGRNLLGDPMIMSDNGHQPGLVLVTGHFSTIQDSTGQFVQFLEGQGRVVDVIDLLV
jgi:hypothetical protein